MIKPLHVFLSLFPWLILYLTNTPGILAMHMFFAIIATVGLFLAMLFQANTNIAAEANILEYIIIVSYAFLFLNVSPLVAMAKHTKENPKIECPIVVEHSIDCVSD